MLNSYFDLIGCMCKKNYIVFLTTKQKKFNKSKWNITLTNVFHLKQDVHKETPKAIYKVKSPVP